MIKIANLLLTRRCNLNCFYCGISANIDYNNKPVPYPSKLDYFKKELDTNTWIDYINKLYKHNPEIFLVIYGGEPFLRKDLSDIIIHCNNIGINYTIISSCNENIQNKINEFFEKVSKVKGFSASVDPGFNIVENNEDSITKSSWGFNTLKRLMSMDLIEDPVAEITVTNNNIQYLEDTVKLMTDNNITSDITFVEIAKNPWYDFSTIKDESLCVIPSDSVVDVFYRLVGSDYKIHMRETVLPDLLNHLPYNLNCYLEEDLHNITIDSDGRLRLCLRIRGEYVSIFNLDNMFDNNGNIILELTKLYGVDKTAHCEGCIWSCAIMSQLDSNDIINH